MCAPPMNKLLDIRLGAIIFCWDGRAGRVTRLVVEPTTRRVTHIVVEHGLLHHEVVSPIGYLEQAGDGSLALNMILQDLASLPHYAEVDYLLPEPSRLPQQAGVMTGLGGRLPHGLPLDISWSKRFVKGHTHRGLPSDETPIGRDTQITNREGHVGRLGHVLLDQETDVVQALVVRSGHLSKKDICVPADRIAWIDEVEIHIKADRSQLEEFPAHHAPERELSSLAR